MFLFKKKAKASNEETEVIETVTSEPIEDSENESDEELTKEAEEKVKKKEKKNKKEDKEPPKEIIIREKSVDEGDFYDSPEADPDSISEEDLLNYNPDDEEDIDGVKKRNRADKNKGSKKSAKKAIIISIVAVFLTIVLVFIFAGGSYSFKNAVSNIQNWFMGTDAGDGFPVGLTGSGADKMGFFSQNGEVFVLTDTSFTSVSISGEENFSHRHSCSLPTVTYSDGKYVIYDMGGLSYIVGSGTEPGRKFIAENGINSADISKSGKYSILTQSQDYSAELLVYNKNNELIFTYKYAENYPIATAVSPDGSKAAAVTINENGGDIYCVIAIFDLTKPEPVAQYVTAGNFITELHWEDNTLFALGDNALVSCDSYNNFVEYEFSGSTITASDYCGGKMFVSVSDYNYAGSSVLYIFDNSASNVKTLVLEDRIEDISAYGNYVSLLMKKTVYCYDTVSLTLVSSGSAAYDTISIAMVNDTGVYSLGVTEVNYISLKLEE